jgi:hypothetical protein
VPPSWRADLGVAGAFVLALAYVGLLSGLGRGTWAVARPALLAQLPPGEALISHTLSPQPADPFCWEIVAQTQAAVYRRLVTCNEPVGVFERIPSNVDDPLVRRLAGRREVWAWRIFARQPVALITRVPAGWHVELADARYGLGWGRRGFATLALDVPDAAASDAPSGAPAAAADDTTK